MTDLISYNPASSNVLWQKPISTATDVDKAVMSARKAFPHWARKSADDRMTIVEKYVELLTQNKEKIAEAIAQETGKALWDATGEASAMIGKAAISWKAYQERTGERNFEMGADMMGHLTHRPHGVMAVFGPYNFPAHLPNGHVVPAIIAGNCVVFKPSELTPMVGEMMVNFWHEAGLPEGVLNIVQGLRETGEALAAHDQIDGLLFTGSSSVGGILSEQFAKRPEKILALEMGGNNPLIIWDSPDVKAAAYHTILSAFITTGQRCTCARRLIIADNQAGNDLLDELVLQAKQVKFGTYDDSPEPFMGPLIRRKEAENVIEAQQALEASGASLLLKSELPRDNLPFITPGIADVTSLKQRNDQEFFAPFLQVIRVNSFDEAIAEANNTRYGLSASVFTRDEKLYQQALVEIRAGLINWNRQTTGASGALPFGGIGISGNHRPAGYYAADYCSYPVASVESRNLDFPEVLANGLAR